MTEVAGLLENFVRLSVIQINSFKVLALLRVRQNNQETIIGVHELPRSVT